MYNVAQTLRICAAMNKENPIRNELKQWLLTYMVFGPDSKSETKKTLDAMLDEIECELFEDLSSGHATSLR